MLTREICSNKYAIIRRIILSLRKMKFGKYSFRWSRGLNVYMKL